MEFEAEVSVIQPAIRPNGNKAVQVVLISPAPPLPKSTEQKPATARVEIALGQKPVFSVGDEIRLMLNLSLKEWDQIKQKFIFGDVWRVSIEDKRVVLKRKQ